MEKAFTELSVIEEDLARIVFLRGPDLPDAIQNKGIRFEFEWQKPPLTSYDAFLTGFIFLAMSRGGPFRIKGPLTIKALRNMQLFQEAWHCLRPEKYAVVPIEPDEVLLGHDSTSSPNNKWLSAFSGGADSTFLLLQNNHLLQGHNHLPVSHALLVHGFDVPYQDQTGFNLLREKVTPLLDSLSIAPIVIKTNVREYDLQKWEDSFMAQLVCCLQQFSADFSYGVVGSTQPYNALLLPWGSSAATDYLLSGTHMEIIHEGAAFSRTDKINLIAKNPLATKSLQICWAGIDRYKNCGICEKCVRTRLNFLACGMENPACFDSPFDLKMLDNISITSEALLNTFNTIVTFANRNKLSGPWLSNLNKLIRLSERQLTKPFLAALISPKRLIQVTKSLAGRGKRYLKRRFLATNTL